MDKAKTLTGAGAAKAIAALVSMLLAVSFVPTAGVAHAAGSDAAVLDVAASATSADGSSEEASVSPSEVTATISGNYTITYGGTYQLAEGASGGIIVATQDPVVIQGNGVTIADDGSVSSTPNVFWIDASYAGGNADITLQDVYISNSFGFTDHNLLNFTGEGNVLRIEGVNVLDHDINEHGYASVHVPYGSELTVLGSGTLYFYKRAQGAGFGGNGTTTGSDGEGNGTLVFGDAASNAGPTVFAKGTKQGALIGAGAGAKGNSTGTITFYGGTYNLISNSRSAAIGGGAGSQGASAGSEVHVCGGSININVDWSGAAIGGGGYDSGNDSDGGTLYVSGGSLRVYMDSNAVENENWSNAEVGVDDTAITATKLNGNGLATVQRVNIDTSTLATPADEFKVYVDGVAFYSGRLHEYDFVNQNLNKTDGEQIEITSTPSNWAAMTEQDTNLYLYLAEGTDHTVLVNGQTYTVTWDDETSTFAVDTSAPEFETVAIPTAAEGLVYDGSEQVGVAAGEGYTVTGGSATDAGDYTATATLADGYAWFDGTTEPKTVAWSIAKADISSAQVSLPKDSYTYTGLPLSPAPTVTLGGAELSAGTDYAVSYADNTQAGTATVAVAGAGNYQGTVSATFAIVAGEAPSYSDVDFSGSDYYLAAVEWITRAGLMTGYSDGSGDFGVGDSLTRGQLAVLLWRYAEPEEAAAYDADGAVDTTGKADAVSGQYYTGAVNWAVSSGVVNGYSDGTNRFGAEDTVTFEQMVAILVNYQVYAGNVTREAVDASPASALAGFSDAAKVDGWAVASLSWGYTNGVFSGYDRDAYKEICPLEDVVRERCAAVLYNLCAAGLLPTA